MGLLDRIVDKQKARVIRDALTTEHAELAIETALDKADEIGNPIVRVITPWISDNATHLAELLNGFLLAYALGEDGMHETNEPEVRTLMRIRIHRQAIYQAQEKHPDWSRPHARQIVRGELTDERIVEAIKQTAHKICGVAAEMMAGITDWWTWLKDNWSWQVFFSIVGILLMFI